MFEENGIIHSYLQQSTKTPALVHVSRFSRTLFTVSWNDPNKPACKISSKSKLLMRVVADNKTDSPYRSYRYYILTIYISIYLQPGSSSKMHNWLESQSRTLQKPMPHCVVVEGWLPSTGSIFQARGHTKTKKGL